MVAGEDLEQRVTTEFFNRKDSALQWHVLLVPASHKDHTITSAQELKVGSGRHWASLVCQSSSLQRNTAKREGTAAPPRSSAF